MQKLLGGGGQVMTPERTQEMAQMYLKRYIEREKEREKNVPASYSSI